MSKKPKRTKEETIALYNTYIPVIAPKIKEWKADEQGIVTLSIENKGVMNTLMQKLIHKPRISYVHLDEMGSFIWQQLDGKTNVAAIAAVVHAHFGENAEPLYERLLKFFEIVERYDFIFWLKPDKK